MWRVYIISLSSLYPQREGNHGALASSEFFFCAHSTPEFVIKRAYPKCRAGLRILTVQHCSYHFKSFLQIEASYLHWEIFVSVFELHSQIFLSYFIYCFAYLLFLVLYQLYHFIRYTNKMIQHLFST